MDRDDLCIINNIDISARVCLLITAVEKEEMLTIGLIYHRGGISAEDTYNCISVAVEKQNRKMVTLLLKNYEGVIHNDILLPASKMGSISIIKLLLTKVERIDSSLFRNLIDGEHVDLIIYTLKMNLLEEDSLNLTPQQVQEYQTVLIFFQTWEIY